MNATYKHWDFSCKEPNNCVVLKIDGFAIVFLIENFLKTTSEVFVVGRRYLEVDDFFDYPIPSSLIGTFLVRKISPYYECFPLSCIKAKSYENAF